MVPPLAVMLMTQLKVWKITKVNSLVPTATLKYLLYFHLQVGLEKVGCKLFLGCFQQLYFDDSQINLNSYELLLYMS